MNLKLTKLNLSKNIVAVFITAAGLSVSCTPKPTADSGTKTTTAEKLAAGKTIYENSCNRCHDLPEPTAHSAQEWVGIMNWMAPKAKLTAEQHALVYDYVVSVKK